MRFTNLKFIFQLFFFIIGFNQLSAQVTIGSDNIPAKGAMLDLKQYEADTPGGKTSDLGFLLPRVELIKSTTLEPCANDSLSQEHLGLMVVNVATVNDVCPGLYVWNGDKWLVVVGGCIGFDQDEYRVLVGDTLSAPTLQRAENLWGDGTLTWSSSNPSVATVNSVTGLVDALSIGVAEITATSGSITASYQLDVDDVAITVSPANSTIESGENVQLTATVTPEWLTDKSVSWISSSPSIATVDTTGLVTGVNSGSTTITATTVVRNKSALADIIVAARCPSTMVDADGNVYDVVQIGNQCWTANNLYTVTTRANKSITARINEGYYDSSNSAYSVDSYYLRTGSIASGTYGVSQNSGVRPNNSQISYKDFVKTYGLLYDYSQASSICPDGWHLPTEQDWSNLANTLQSAPNADDAGANMRSYWKYYFVAKDNSTNHQWGKNDGSTPPTSGFDAVPAGYAHSSQIAKDFGYSADWWTATSGTGIKLLFDSTQLNFSSFSSGGDFLSVRCVKD